MKPRPRIYRYCTAKAHETHRRCRKCKGRQFIRVK